MNLRHSSAVALCALSNRDAFRELGIHPVCSGERRGRWRTQHRRRESNWRHAFASSMRQIALLRNIEPRARSKRAAVTQNQQKAVRLTRRAVGRAAGAECKPEGSRTRLVAQLLQEFPTDGSVALGPLEPMLPLSLMRPLEALPDPPEDALPALSFHSGTSAA